MKKKVSAVKARKNFGELLNRVSLLGEEIIIERAGKEIAKITRIAQENITSTGKLDFRKSKGLGTQLWKKVDIEKYLTKERNNWD